MECTESPLLTWHLPGTSRVSCPNCWPRYSQVVFVIASLRCSSYTVRFSLSECAIPWFLVHSQIVQAPAQPQDLSVASERSPKPLALSCPLFPHFPQLEATTGLLSVCQALLGVHPAAQQQGGIRSLTPRTQGFLTVILCAHIPSWNGAGALSVVGGLNCGCLLLLSRQLSPLPGLVLPRSLSLSVLACSLEPGDTGKIGPVRTLGWWGGPQAWVLLPTALQPHRF